MTIGIAVRSLLSLALGVSALIFGAAPAHAQFGFPGIGADLSINSSPEYPAPNATVFLSIRSNTLDIAGSDIRWYANDTLIAEGPGLSETTLTAGPLGSETRVRAEVTGQAGTFVGTGVLRPTEVDLLWESDSYVPPFYRGRAMASPGSNVRLFAVPRFERPGTNSFVSPDELVYTWKKNNKILQSSSGRGKHSITIEGPVLFGSDTITIEIRSADAVLRGFASVRISSTNPVLALYETHPVFGTLYHQALRRNAVVPEVETAFTVVPYFAPVRSSLDRLLVYEWSINDTPVPTSSTNPNSITINAEGSTGVAQIELSLTHATNFFLDALGAWNITFGGASGISSDPFGTSEP